MKPKRLKIDETLTLLDGCDGEDEEEDIDYNPAEEEDEEDDDEDDSFLDLESFLPDGENEVVPALVATVAEPSEGDHNYEDLISTRTRSKHHVEEVSDNTNNFPDATADLYGPSDTEFEDEDWTLFLNTLYGPNPFFDDLDDQDKDPDFNLSKRDEVIATENAIVGQVSRREHAALVNDSDEVSHENPEVNITEAEKWTALLTKDNVHQMCEQMTQHVQLLTQSYLLCKDKANLIQFTKQSRSLLRELVFFGKNKPVSVFNTVNLNEACQVVNSNPIEKFQGKKDRGWRLPPVPKSIQTIFIKHPNIFRSAELIPKCGFHDYDPKIKTKTNFTIAEDYLIAIGLEQHKICAKNISMRRTDYIQKFLVDTKTVSQIKIHIKNKRRRQEESNPLCHFFKKGEVPPCTPRIPCPLEPVSSYTTLDKLPQWLQLEINETQSSRVRTVPAAVKRTVLQSTTVTGNEINKEMDKSVSFQSKVCAMKNVWSAEEDRDILQAVKAEITKNQSLDNKVFKSLAAKMKRNAESIAARLGVLMEIFKETTTVA